MDFPRHGGAAGIGGLRQLFSKGRSGLLLRLLVAYAALRVFFFTLVFFLVALRELRFSWVTLASGFCFFRFPDFPISRSPDSRSHSAPLRTAALRLLCHLSEPSSPAISL